MGANSCTLSEDKKYRFKGFVVSVYPDKVGGKLNEDALDKLSSYVKSNPERVPRVCRKIAKILIRNIQKKRQQRVMVSVQMLHSLIARATTVSGFVPHCIKVCSVLLATDVLKYRIGAADLLCVLCYQLSLDDKAESSRRLLADNKMGFLGPLEKMCSERMAGHADAEAMQGRYASVLAIGHIAWCLRTALAGIANELMSPLMINLMWQLQECAQRPISEKDAHALMRDCTTERVGLRQPPSVILTGSADERSMAYITACCFAIGAVAGCVTTAGAQVFLAHVIDFLEKYKAWSVPFLASAAFRALVTALQSGPQQLGFAMCEVLTDVGAEHTEPEVQLGVLRGLEGAMEVVPMSGRRPQRVLRYVVDILSRNLEAAYHEHTEVLHVVLDAVFGLEAALWRATYRQLNRPLLQTMLAQFMHLLEVASEPVQVLQRLRCLTIAAPYLRVIPLADRDGLTMVAAIEPYLSSSDVSLRVQAARVLRGVLAGIPDDGVSTFDNNAAASSVSSSESDAVVAEAWLTAMMQDTKSVTPYDVVEVTNVMTAIMAGFGISSLPFVLAKLWAVQLRCAQSADAAPPSETERTPTMQSHSATSPLTRAWLHAVVVTLINCGRIFMMPKLREYGEELLKRRGASQPPELASVFEPALTFSTQRATMYTSSGLTAVVGAESMQPLSAELRQPPVTKLPSFAYVANIIIDAERPDVTAVFGASAPGSLRTAIEDVCFQPDSESKVGLSSVLSANTSAVSPVAATRPAPFTLDADAPEGDVRSPSDLTITLADEKNAARLDGQLSTHVTSTTTRGKLEEVLKYFGVRAGTTLLPAGTTAAVLSLADLAGGQSRSLSLSLHNSKGPQRLSIASVAEDDTNAGGAYNTNASVGGITMTDAVRARLSGDNDNIHRGNSHSAAEGGPWLSDLPSSKYVDLL